MENKWVFKCVLKTVNDRAGSGRGVKFSHSPIPTAHILLSSSYRASVWSATTRRWTTLDLNPCAHKTMTATTCIAWCHVIATIFDLKCLDRYDSLLVTHKLLHAIVAHLRRRYAIFARGRLSRAVSTDCAKRRERWVYFVMSATLAAIFDLKCMDRYDSQNWWEWHDKSLTQLDNK